MVLHFLLDDPLTAGPGDAVALTGSEAHHAAAVRRVREGETVSIGDGRGTWLRGHCESVAAREVVVRIDVRDEIPAPAARVALVQALAKGDRDELAVQAATELGVDRIVPWQAERSVSRWNGPKREKGRARWQHIVREAAKQAHRAWVPAVTELVTVDDLLPHAGTGTVLVLVPGAEQALSQLELPAQGAITLVVGPEGGISDSERAALTAAGAREVRLGQTVLRTSTAGPAALALVNAALGRW